VPDLVIDPQGVGEVARTLSATPYDLHAWAVVLRAAPSLLHDPLCDHPRILAAALDRFVRDEARAVDGLAVGTAALARHLDEAAASWVSTEQSSASGFRAVASW
jgi:hypothetical protein